jgi:hypothetical protein
MRAIQLGTDQLGAEVLLEGGRSGDDGSPPSAA